METIDYELKIPEGYERIELPFFNEWVKALESGEYEQGYRNLCLNNKYCCLGVLSKVQGRLRPDGTDNERCWATLADDNPCFTQLHQVGLLPEGVEVVFEHQGHNSLVVCNDSGLTFRQIANIIKALWKPINTKS
jgi:hypothetical protein